jgi:hypothetical protein
VSSAARRHGRWQLRGDLDLERELLVGRQRLKRAADGLGNVLNAIIGEFEVELTVRWCLGGVDLILRLPSLVTSNRFSITRATKSSIAAASWRFLKAARAICRRLKTQPGRPFMGPSEHGARRHRRCSANYRISFHQEEFSGLSLEPGSTG